MWIDELYKFSDGTLTDVCTALDDRLKGIRMKYLPQSIWRKSDKYRAATMIQDIDKMLKTRRIMMSLERDDDKDDDEEGGDDEHESDEETREEESFDPIPQTPEDSKDEGDGKEDLGLNIGEEERHDEKEKEDELYRDVNVNQGRGLTASLKVKDSHVTLTPVHPDGQQESSSVSSQFVTSMLNPTLDVGIESIFETTSQFDVPTPTSVAPLPITTPTMTYSTIATTTTTSQAPILPTTVSSDIIQNLPSFGSMFCFDDRLRSSKENFSEFRQTNQFSRAVKEQVKAQVSKILPRIEQAVNEQLEVEVLTRSSHSLRTSYVVAADFSEMELKKILIEKMEGNTLGSKRRREGNEPESASALTETVTRSAGRSTQGSTSIQALTSESALSEEPMQTTSQIEEPSYLEFDTGADDQPIVQSSQHPECIQPWISELAKQADSRSSFNELMDTPLDFSNFLLNRLKVDTLTQELLAGLTYELMKGSCKSLVELEYHLEEVFKATTDQLDWVNPEGQQYPHNLLQPLPLIPNNRGRLVIPFEHFINNDLEYLCGGASSRKYTTSITKTKAADYGESARDVYSKRRIIAVTELKIVEWHSYKHLDWITVRRDDDKLYKFKEVEERFAFNVSLRMFTRSIVIQRRVEDLQLGVESYQMKLNLTKPDSYRSDLKRKEAYTAYSNLRGFINQNKDKKNRLMRIDELHKFSDRTLTDVRTALNDCLKGIQMRYKVVRYRYSNPMIQPELEGSTQRYPLVSVEVLRYDKRSKSENMGIVLTEMELILEHTQQGISHEVSVSKVRGCDIYVNESTVAGALALLATTLFIILLRKLLKLNQVMPGISVLCCDDIYLEMTSAITGEGLALQTNQFHMCYYW
nr:hypothetical protein [Tanacetum cinerariifolium]